MTWVLQINEHNTVSLKKCFYWVFVFGFCFLVETIGETGSFIIMERDVLYATENARENSHIFPPKLGGLGIPIISEIEDREYKFSRIISKDLTTNIMNQHHQYNSNNNETNIRIKSK